MSDVPSGWYPDPQGLADERYHDGADWTSQTRIAPAPESDVKVRPQVAHEDLFKTQRATMHYMSTLAILAVTFVYTFVMSVIIALGIWGAAVADGGGSAFGAVVAFVASIALIVGFISLLSNFMQAYKQAKEWAEKPINSVEGGPPQTVPRLPAPKH